MGGMMMSTFLMFVPREITFLFLVVCCVGFFGIFIPWQERKKKKSSPKSPPNTPVRANSGPDPSKLEQLEALKKAGVLTEEEYRQKREEMFRGL